MSSRSAIINHVFKFEKNSIGRPDYMVIFKTEVMRMETMIILPDPEKKLDYPLMKALENRRTTRKWKDDELSEQELSNLLWAACGITKIKKGNMKSKRTVPSACNSQEIRVYVLMKQGVFLYNEDNNELFMIHSKDIRENIGTQKMMKSAPLGLVFVADLSRMSGPLFKSQEARQFCAWVDTGYISQNIYLYCAASNLGTAVIALVDRETLHESMNLQDHEKIVVTQVVGHSIE